MRQSRRACRAYVVRILYSFGEKNTIDPFKEYILKDKNNMDQLFTL